MFGRDIIRSGSPRVASHFIRTAVYQGGADGNGAGPNNSRPLEALSTVHRNAVLRPLSQVDAAPRERSGW